MIVEINLIRDGGIVVYRTVMNARIAGGWEAPIGTPVIDEQGHEIRGFTYLPCPPPRDPTDVAEFRRLVAEHFGSQMTDLDGDL
jgi:hypothetical protein